MVEVYLLGALVRLVSAASLGSAFSAPAAAKGPRTGSSLGDGGVAGLHTDARGRAVYSAAVSGVLHILCK
jgi:hypothetical protein